MFKMKKQLNIAFMIDGFPVISETFILNQITGLIDLGHHVEIFPRYKTDPEVIHADILQYKLLDKTHYIDEIMPLTRFQKIAKAAGLFLTHFWKDPLPILKSLNIFKYKRGALNLRYFLYTIHFLDKDVIHCHFGTNGKDYLFLKDIFGAKVKYITSFHGYDLTKSAYLKNGTYKDLFVLGDLFLPISQTWKDKLVSLGCCRENIFVHHMGINLNKFAYREKQLHDKEIQVLTVARLVEKKGLVYSIRAVAKIAAGYPHIQYTIAGDGPLRKQLEELTGELGMRDRIHLAGPLSSDHISALMEKTHIYILASVTAQDGDQEGIPVSLMEAMATGLPVISTRHSGIPELVQDGISGFLVPERDVDALAEKCEYLISHPQRRAEMGRVGRKFIEEHFEISKLNGELVELYSSSLKTSDKQAGKR